MRILMQPILIVVGLLLGLAGTLAQARDGVLNAIPSDVIGFAVIHKLTDASRSIDEVAKFVQAPAPDLLSLAKRMTGLQKGLDEQGDVAIVLTSLDPAPKHVVLVPVANFADFFAALSVKEPGTGIIEVQLAGKPTLVGRKGSFAAFALATDRDALEQLLASETNLATDAPLAAWLDANQASVVVTTSGVKQVLPKLTNGIRAIQAQIRQVSGVNGVTTADALNVYLDLFTAAETEVAHFGLGLRIDSAQTVDLVKRVQFTPEGVWAQWAANAKPAADDLLAGLPAGPFVAAIGGVIPPGAMDHLMKFSVQMMQKQPQFKLTPEQAQKYVELCKGMMSGVHTVRMLLGVAEPETGLYGNTTIVMTVDNSPRFIEGYEKSLAAVREFAQEKDGPAIPVATTKRIMLGKTEVLEVVMDLSSMNRLTTAGGQDPQKVMQLMTGSNGNLKVYIAPADDHTVVMAYTSLERLKSALDFYKSKQPGLAGDAGVAKVAAALPSGSQVVAYAGLGGIAKVVRQFAPMVPGGQPTAIPDFPECPPVGMAAMVSAAGAEGHLIITAETLRAIGDVVATARHAVPGPTRPQQ